MRSRLIMVRRKGGLEWLVESKTKLLLKRKPCTQYQDVACSSSASYYYLLGSLIGRARFKAPKVHRLGLKRPSFSTLSPIAAIKQG
jgi:hypothetical protein